MFCKQNGGKMNGVWKDEEVIDLFNVVEKCKSAGKRVSFAFQEHAEKYSRKANSVRNCLPLSALECLILLDF